MNKQDIKNGIINIYKNLDEEKVEVPYYGNNLYPFREYYIENIHNERNDKLMTEELFKEIITDPIVNRTETKLAFDALSVNVLLNNSVYSCINRYVEYSNISKYVDIYISIIRISLKDLINSNIKNYKDDETFVIDWLSSPAIIDNMRQYNITIKDLDLTIPKERIIELYLDNADISRRIKNYSFIEALDLLSKSFNISFKELLFNEKIIPLLSKLILLKKYNNYLLTRLENRLNEDEAFNFKKELYKVYETIPLKRFEGLVECLDEDEVNEILKYDLKLNKFKKKMLINRMIRDL